MVLDSTAVNLDTMDLSGTQESDDKFAKHMEVHKIRLGSDGRRLEGKEYYTPESKSDAVFNLVETAQVQYISIS